MAIDRRDSIPISFMHRELPLKPDLVLVLTYLAITAIGLLMVYSATAPGLENRGLDPTTELKEQAIFVVIGFVVFGLISWIDLTEIRGFVTPIYVISMLLLVLVFVVGDNAQGAIRWIDIGFLRFQPSEVAKVATILALASVLAAVEPPLRWVSVARSVMLVALPGVLIFLQPDLGTMLVFAFVLITMLFVAGATARQLAFLAVVTIIGTVGVFQLNLIQQYQINRLTAFVNPGAHELSLSYNQVQSEIAIGSGGLFGKGLFEGSQTNLEFVPVQASDFIFTAVGEQFGFIGCVTVIVLIGILLWRLLRIAQSARNRFGYLVTMGVAAMLAFHAFVNIGMTVRIMPVTGLPLPFMSSGGTFFVVMSAALGLAHSSWIRRPPAPGEARRDS
ncbi:MAG: rod shape-determining protein RodA [Acidimicrobiia bacterium]